jgi:hypothetical protein
MKFMIMHKMTAELEKGLPPDAETLSRIQKLIGDAVEKKVFVSGEGLGPTAQRMHIVYKKGKRKVTQGPFKDARELVGGFGLLTVHSKDEALAWLDKFGAVLGDVELFVGPVIEPWDLGMGPKPAEAPLRFLSLHRAEDDSPPPDAKVLAKMGALIEEMTRAGVLQATGALAPTRNGARLRFEGNKHTVIDGPFAESKELVAGYAMLDLPSKAAAIEWAVPFGEIVKVNEVEVRQLAE